jgi:hypothetical protein
MVPVGRVFRSTWKALMKEALRGGIEPPARGFSVRINELGISHHFQALTGQGFPGTMLEYVGFCWVIFGSDGYSLVTVLVGNLT